MSGWLYFRPSEEVDTVLANSSKRVDIHVFGSLRDCMDEQGLPHEIEMEVPPEGRIAYDLVRELHLPVDKVESVFRNGRVINIHDFVSPGDRIALFPHGTPGPYRVFLGIARENVERARRESKARGVPDQS